MTTQRQVQTKLPTSHQTPVLQRLAGGGQVGLQCYKFLLALINESKELELGVYGIIFSTLGETWKKKKNSKNSGDRKSPVSWSLVRHRQKKVTIPKVMQDFSSKQYRQMSPYVDSSLVLIKLGVKERSSTFVFEDWQPSRRRAIYEVSSHIQRRFEIARGTNTTIPRIAS